MREKQPLKTLCVRCLIIGMTLISLSTLSYSAEKLTMNMRDADIRALIQWVADNTGKNIVVHRDVKGKVTVLSPEPLTVDEAYQVFLSVLQVHQYAVIETPEALKIVPRSIAAGGALPYAAGSTNADMVVSVVKIENTSVVQMAEALRPLMSKDAVIKPYVATNALVLADHASNINSARQLIRQLDKASDSEIDVIALQHADAESVLQSLSTLLPSGSQQADALNINISANERSNSILLAGDPAKRKQFRELIKKLDTPMDGDGNTQVVYLHYVDASEIVPILENLAKSIQSNQKDTDSNISIEASESANALVINAPPSILATMKTIVSQLDIRRAQVMIEAILVEVRGELASDVGVTWITDPDNSIIGAVNTLGDLSLADAPSDGSSLPFSAGRGFTFGYFNSGDLQAALRALSATQNASILSTPTIVALDNEEASLLVGQNVPFITGQSTSAASSTNDPFTTIERQDIGTSLVVTPRINQGDSITLEINQKTETIAPSIDIASDIVTNKREIITKALIRDDQVLVIGGLINDEETEIVEKVPILGDIPFLGKLFSSKGTSHTKTNLMVFIHPTILRNDKQIEQMTQKRYQYMQGLQQQVRDNEWKIDPEDSAVLKDFSTFTPSVSDTEN
ncbi:MAG: type II secretion system secretin GspD [Oceanicoccus sp.]